MKGVVFVLGLWMLAGVQSATIDKICAEPQGEQSEWKQHCQAYLVGEHNLLELHCKVLLVSNEKREVGLLTTLKLTGKDPNEENEPSQCLPLTSVRLQKVNPSKFSNSERVSHQITISNEVITYFEKIKDIDVNFLIQADSKIGGVNYDSNCVRDRASRLKGRYSTDYVNVSTCVSSVKLNNHSTTLGDGFRSFSINFITDKFGLTQIRPTLQSANCSFFPDRYLQFAKQTMQMFANYKIENLHLRGAGTEQLKNRYFPSMPELRLLDLSECGITEIDRGEFSSLPNLNHLNLAGNKFQKLPFAVFELNRLETLNLSSIGEFNSNDLKEFSNLSKGLRSLINLDLSGTRLNLEMSASILSTQIEIPSLKVLNISNTSFSPIFIMALKFSELEVLILSHNQLNNDLTHHLNMINFWDQLHTFDLSGNLLTDQFDSNFLFNKFQNLRRLNLAENQFREFPLLKLNPRGNDNSMYLNFSSNRIQTWNTSKLELDPKVVNLTLDLTNNTITEVSSFMLSDFSNTHSIFLRGNKFNCNSSSYPKFELFLRNNRAHTDSDKFIHECFKSSANVNRLQGILLFMVIVISTFVKLN